MTATSSENSTMLLILFFWLLGGGALVASFRHYQEARAQRTWASTEARILLREVGLSESPTGGARQARFVPTLRYEFVVDGTQYEGSRLLSVTATDTEEAARAYLAQLPETVQIFYNPENPTESSIERTGMGWSLFLAAVGVLCCMAALAAR
jgi:hypothetical protein